MPIGHLSVRIDAARRDHHLWINNGGVYWVHYTLHFDHRKRRVRRSLGTRDLERAIELRDELLAHIREHGEVVAPRGGRGDGSGHVSALRMPDSMSVASSWWPVGA